MKIKFILLALVATVIFSCHKPTMKESITDYTDYYKKHKISLDSIVKHITTRYSDSGFSKIDTDSLKSQLSVLAHGDDELKVLEDIKLVQFYKYANDKKGVRFFFDIPYSSCISISLFKTIEQNELECKNSKDSLYLGNCWTVFLIKQSPCSDPF